MLEMLVATWVALIGLLSGVWEVVELVLVWMWSIGYHLHTDAPRLEGLLIGVILSWLLLRRDKHPILRILSAPLKLILDILDLAWDQLTEVVSDTKETIYAWLQSTVGRVLNKLKEAGHLVMQKLRNIKDKLSNKEKESTED